tara:strand:- start:14104 stop:14472 length:369 start_codon:yes stop_codon:yes gene_type:complete
MTMPKIADPMSLLVNSQAVENEIQADENDPDVVVKVWVKELSFMQLQDAIKSFVTIGANGSVDIDLAAYWKYMFAEAIEKTEPRLSIPQMLSLRPFIANQITALLPQPQDLMSGPLADGATE